MQMGSCLSQSLHIWELNSQLAKGHHQPELIRLQMCLCLCGWEGGLVYEGISLVLCFLPGQNWRKLKQPIFQDEKITVIVRSSYCIGFEFFFFLFVVIEFFGIVWV